MTAVFPMFQQQIEPHLVHAHILIEVHHLQDVPSPYMQIKGVNKEIVTAAGSTLKLDGFYTTKSYLEIILERLPGGSSGIHSQHSAKLQQLLEFIQSQVPASSLKSEMVYVGKSNKPELVRKIASVIQTENISSIWNDMEHIWFFWTRLESMLFSKIQLPSVDEGDPVLREIKKLLSYDKSGSWAMYSRGPNIAINGFGTTVLTALQNFDEWKPDVEKKGFDAAFKEYYEKLHDRYHPCCRLEFPSTAGRTPDNMKCPECHRFMEKFLTFSCCHDTPM